MQVSSQAENIMERITLEIELDDQTASAYRNASPALQSKLQERIRRSIRRALLSREAIVDEFDRITTEAGAHASAQGWTDELNEALLRGDFDHE